MTDPRSIDQVLAEASVAQRESSPVDSVLGRDARSGGGSMDHEAGQTLSPYADAEEAFLLDVRIRQRRERLEVEFLALGQDLATMRDRELYTLLDYDSFDAYLAAPERAFRRSTAYKLIRVAETCSRLHIPAETAAVIGHEKLDVVRRPLLEGGDPQEWLHQAAASGKTDLRQSVREWLRKQRKAEPEVISTEDLERQEDLALQAEVEAALRSGTVVRVEFGRWPGLRIAMDTGKLIRVWASGGALKVEVV